MDRQGAVGKEQHVAWKVSVAETPSLAIKERLFKALRAYLQLSKGSQGVCAEHLWQFQSRPSCCSWELAGSPAAENLLYKCHSCLALQESCTYPWQGLAVPHPASHASDLRHNQWSLKEWRSPSFGSASGVWVFNHPLGLKVWQPWDWRLVGSGTWSINLHHQIPTQAQLEQSQGLVLAQRAFLTMALPPLSACPGTWLHLCFLFSLCFAISIKLVFPQLYFLKWCLQVLLGKNFYI